MLLILGEVYSDYELPQIIQKPREYYSDKPELIRSLKRQCCLQVCLSVLVTLAVSTSCLLLFLEGKVTSDLINYLVNKCWFQYPTLGRPRLPGVRGQPAPGHVEADLNWDQGVVHHRKNYLGYFANTSVGTRGKVRRYRSATLRYHVISPTLQESR